MKYNTNFFTEANGKPSATRLMSFASLLTAVALSLLTILYADDDSKDEGLLLVYAFLTSATAPKIIQKNFEVKDDTDKHNGYIDSPN